MTVHVVGAGLAGLACALAVADAGHTVVVHEAAGHAGGRCRSWMEPRLGRLVDNGTHVVAGGNRAVFSYLERIGASEALRPATAAFPMVDLANGTQWTASPAKLLPTLLTAAWRLRGGDAPIGERLGHSRHFRHFWEPIGIAVMNTPPDSASSHVFRRVLARTLWRGSAASRPFLARGTLSEVFVFPALTALAMAGVTMRPHHPLRSLAMDNSRAVRLIFDDENLVIGRRDAVVLALPWTVAASLLSDLPQLPSSPIVNAHFLLPLSIPASDGFFGLLGGTGQWLFRRGDLLSVTVSAASALMDRPVTEIAAHLWDEAATALDLKGGPLAYRVIKEKRATLFHSPEVERRRPRAKVGENLFLAGDWTATGLPCTLESAILSGAIAARGIKASLGGRSKGASGSQAFVASLPE